MVFKNLLLSSCDPGPGIGRFPSSQRAFKAFPFKASLTTPSTSPARGALRFLLCSTRLLRRVQRPSLSPFHAGSGPVPRPLLRARPRAPSLAPRLSAFSSPPALALAAGKPSGLFHRDRSESERGGGERPRDGVSARWSPPPNTPGFALSSAFSASSNPLSV